MIWIIWEETGPHFYDLRNQMGHWKVQIKNDRFESVYYGLGWLLPFFSNNLRFKASSGIEHRIKLNIHQDG